MGDSENAKKLFFEALTFLDSSNFPAAEQKLREAERLAPTNASILTNLSVVLIAQNKRDEGRACAEKVVALKPDNIEALLVLADCHAHDQNFEAALAAYDRVVALEPGMAEAHNNRGLVLESLGRPADALASFDRALALPPGLANAQVNRGNILHQLKRHDEALAAHETALAQDASLTEGWLGRGNVLHDLKRPDEALAAYDEALARDPGLPYAWLGRGNVLSTLKRNEEAFDAFGRALALKPDLVEALVGRGNALCDLKRHDEAVAAFDSALALSPGAAAAWLGRGNVLHDRKRYEEALAAYDKALALDPAIANAWRGRGDALRFLHRPEEAIAAYRRALACGGEAESIKYYLAALGAEPMPPAMPERFVASLFDAYADNFDKDLVENLKYQTPVLLAEAIRQHASSSDLDILDMGCGTGLMGERVRPLARTLTGIDLSANMLEKARQRQIYDKLVCSDLAPFLQTHDKAFDLVVAADVFVYLGDLAAVFGGVRRALRDGGLFCFSVEGVDTGDFVLRSTLRYAHSADYLRRLAGQHGFTIEALDSHVIRRDAGTNIRGYLAVMRCR